MKFRNQAVPVMDLFQTAFPESTNLFLYRDVVGFTTSFQRIFRIASSPESRLFVEWQQDMEMILGGDWSYVANYLGRAEGEITIAQQCTLWWFGVLDWYLAQYERGVPAMAIDFLDLVGAQEETLAAIFRYCGLSSRGVARGLRAFARDSQAGTSFARENPHEMNQRGLTPEELHDVQAIMARHPKFGQPDFTVPTAVWK